MTAADINERLWLWIAYDNHYFQYQSGFLDEDFWQAQLKTIEGLYNDCEFRFALEWRKAGLRSKFVNLVESFDDLCDQEQQ